MRSSHTSLASMAAVRRPPARNRPAERRRRNDIDLARRERATENRPDAKSSETGADGGAVPRLRRNRERQPAAMAAHATVTLKALTIETLVKD